MSDVRRQAPRNGLGSRAGAVLRSAGASRLSRAAARAARVLPLVAVLASLALPPSLRAQGNPPPPDTARKRPDSLVVPAAGGPDSARIDSLRADSASRLGLGRGARGALLPGDTTKRDTLKTPLATYPHPPSPDIGQPYRWDRRAIFGSGALTLLDLLDQVPGITGFRGGWLPAPMTAAWFGDAGAVRVWLDGVEVDPLNGRTGGAPELEAIPLWTLEEVVVERGAEEVRVHLRSWRASSTTPSTRTDVFTGDDDTNMYRGFFGKRYDNGLALQAGAQQWSTSGLRLAGDGDALDVFGRVGWARGRWSVDAYLQRVRRDRDPSERLDRDFANASATGLPNFTGRWSQAYARAGWGSAESGPWVQLIAASLLFAETSTPATFTGSRPGSFTRDSSDTTRSRAQYVAAAGYTVGPLRLSVEDRYRVFRGERLQTPGARVSFDTRRLALSARAEVGAPDEMVARDSIGAILGDAGRLQRCVQLPVTSPVSGGPADVLYQTRYPRSCIGEPPRVSRVDVTARVLPLSFIAFAGAVGQSRWSREDAPAEGQPENVRSARGEAGLRLGGLWLGAGALWRDSATVLAPIVFGPEYRYDSVGTRRPVRESRGVFGTVRGTIYKGLKADAWAVQWENDSVPFRPKVQTHATLYFASNLLRQFPSGSFSILAAATHEYRSFGWFPTIGGSLERVPQSRVLQILLEIRLLNATISWQQRNSLNLDYMLTPGNGMSGQTNLYGVRWDFFN